MLSWTAEIECLERDLRRDKNKVIEQLSYTLRLATTDPKRKTVLAWTSEKECLERDLRKVHWITSVLA